MTRTMTFEFEQYPLLVSDKFEQGCMDGEAEISYSRDGEWEIKSISLKGQRHNSLSARERADAAGKPLTAWTTKLFSLADSHPIYGMLVAVLEGPKADDIQEAVREQIADDRADAAEFNAEVRREAMWERA